MLDDDDRDEWVRDEWVCGMMMLDVGCWVNLRITSGLPSVTTTSQSRHVYD